MATSKQNKKPTPKRSAPADPYGVFITRFYGQPFCHLCFDAGIEFARTHTKLPDGTWTVNDDE